jgi:hypothetical protein
MLPVQQGASRMAAADEMKVTPQTPDPRRPTFRSADAV